jgi:hypothetical protein
MAETKTNEIASFFAYFKHELEHLRRTTNLREGCSHFRCSDDNFLIQIEEIDRAVYEIVFNRSFEKMKLLIRKHGYLLQNEFLRLKALVAIENINSFLSHQEMLGFEELAYLYLKECNRIMEIVGLAEFCNIIGWDKKRLTSYICKGYILRPIKRINATPLWSIGQIEYFKLILKNREIQKLRGDWSTPHVDFLISIFEEYQIIDDFINNPQKDSLNYEVINNN